MSQYSSFDFYTKTAWPLGEFSPEDQTLEVIFDTCSADHIGTGTFFEVVFFEMNTVGLYDEKRRVRLPMENPWEQKAVFTTQGPAAVRVDYNAGNGHFVGKVGPLL